MSIVLSILLGFSRLDVIRLVPRDDIFIEFPSVDTFHKKSSVAPVFRARGCEGVACCECGLTLQEVRYRVMLNGPELWEGNRKGRIYPEVTGDTR